MYSANSSTSTASGIPGLTGVSNGHPPAPIVGGSNSIPHAYSAIVTGTSNSVGYGGFIGGGSNMVITAGSYMVAHGSYGYPPMLHQWSEQKFESSSKYEKRSDQIWLIDDILDSESCQSIQTAIQDWKKRYPTPINNQNPNSWSDSQTDQEGMKEVGQKLYPYFPQFYQSQDGTYWQFAGINQNYVWGVYEPGNYLNEHLDDKHEAKLENENIIVQSRFTCFIYLNDDFQGGETVFLSKLGEEASEIDRVKPKRGTALFFETELPHRAEKVTEGSKYWVKFDIRYQKSRIQQPQWSGALGRYCELISNRMLFCLSPEIERKKIITQLLLPKFSWLPTTLIVDYYAYLSRSSERKVFLTNSENTLIILSKSEEKKTNTKKNNKIMKHQLPFQKFR